MKKKWPGMQGLTNHPDNLTKYSMSIFPVSAILWYFQNPANTQL